MSPSSFMLVLAIMWVPVIAIYVILFSVGSGFGDKTDRANKAEKPALPAKAESRPERREIRHAA